MKRIAFILAYMFSVAATGNNYAEVITFDSLTATVSSPVPNGYEGFNWSNFDYLTSTPGELSGYPVGTISSPNVGFNGLGDPASFTSAGGSPFTLTSLFLTAAWNDGLNVAVTGLLGGSVLDTETFIVSTATPTLETLNWTGIDTVSISTSGGIPNPDFVPSGQGTEVVVDDITIQDGTTPVPEPWTLGLVGSGVLALAGAVRRRLKG
jgi:hypothetical protein